MLKERQGNNNKNTTERQSNATQLARNSHFSKKNWLDSNPRPSALEATLLPTKLPRQLSGWVRILHANVMIPLLPQPSVIKHSGRVAPPEVEPALFYQPGKAGFYSLVQATPTPERLQVFRGVGRMVGLGLLLAEVFPLPLCRHVLKFIMMKEVSPVTTTHTQVKFVT